MMSKIFIFSFIILIYSCSSGTIKIKTTPENANIYLIDDNGMKSDIGKTPLTLQDNNVFKNSKYAEILIEKENHRSHDLILSKSYLGGDINVNITLDKEINNIAKEDQQIKEKLATDLAKINRLIYSKQYIEAENLLISFTNEYPDVSVGYDYFGNLMYLKKDYAKALNYYNKTHNINSQSIERKKMIEKIQSLMGREN